MAPSSSIAESLKPSVEYRVLNLVDSWKKQMTLPSLAYAGLPYQSSGSKLRAPTVIAAWTRSAMARSESAIPAIFSSTAFSSSARVPAALSSRARSLIAARSSGENPLLVDFFASVMGVSFRA